MKNGKKRSKKNRKGGKKLEGNDRYAIEKTLGEGAFGIVYSAFDKEKCKTVAIKCLKTEESINDFKAELDLLKRLHHPAIVPYIDSFFTKSNQLQIVMEYAENGSLFDIIHNYGPLSEDVASIYVAQILRGLIYLHGQNVIHRDIKAANVLIQGGIAKLADFGLALDLSNYEHSLKECAGSPYWMAPECINGDPIDHKCDIWSLGATIIELIKGHPPLFDLPPMPAMFQIAGDKPIPLPRDISNECLNFLQLCFQKDSRKRPEASELLKHKWLQNAVQMTPAEVFSTTKTGLLSKSATMRLGSICNWVVPTPQEASPEELIFALSDPIEYLQSCAILISQLKTKVYLAQQILSMSGARLFLKRLKEEVFKTTTLTFVQVLSWKSDKFATNFIENGLVQNCLENLPMKDGSGCTTMNYEVKRAHSKITALFLLTTASFGSRFFFASNVCSKISSFIQDKYLISFVPALIQSILSSSISFDLMKARLFNKEQLKFIIQMIFKLVVNQDNYYQLISNSFISTDSIPKGEEKTPEEISKPALVPPLFEEIHCAIDEALSLFSSLISNESISKEIASYDLISPLFYLIIHSSEFPALKLEYIENILDILKSVFELISFDELENVRKIEETLIPALVNFSFSECGNVAIYSFICLSKLLLNDNYGTEIAVKSGICIAISSYLERNDENTIIKQLLCQIPTISTYTCKEMKEAGLFEPFINLPIDIIISPLSKWSQFDPKFINEQFSSNDLLDFFGTYILDSLQDGSDALLNNLILICRASPNLSQYLIEIDGIDQIYNAIQKDRTNSLFFEFLFVLVCNSESPSEISKELLPSLKNLTESPIFGLQKCALRFFVLAQC